MFQDISTAVFSIGPYNQVEVSDIKAGIWTDWFQTFPANALLI